VQRPQALDVLGSLAHIMQAIIGLGQPFVPVNHDGSAVVVKGGPSRFETVDRLEVLGKWISFEAVGRCVTKIVLH
jgi:hypothetical protein